MSNNSLISFHNEDDDQIFYSQTVKPNDAYSSTLEPQ